MVDVLIGDLFESKAQTLVNTVNTVGVMGKGIALEFRRRFPDMYADYVVRCQRHEVMLGRPYLFKRPQAPWILNFPTKKHWRSPSELDAILSGLRYLLEHYRGWAITSLAVPPLGSGQGRLEWRVVGPILYRQLSQLVIPVELYAPFGTPHDELQPTYLDQSTVDLAEATPDRIGAASVALIEVLDRLYRQRYHTPIGRVTFQKMAYFAKQAGIPLDLAFERGSYGPYARDMNRWRSRLINNGLIREDPLGKMLAVRPGPTYPDARRAYSRQLQEWSPIIDGLVDFFLRIQTTDQAELAATVHFVADQIRLEHGNLPTETEVLERVSQWKRSVDRDSISVAIRSLGMLGKLKLRPSKDLPVDELKLIGAKS